VFLPSVESIQYRVAPFAKSGGKIGGLGRNLGPGCFGGLTITSVHRLPYEFQ